MSEETEQRAARRRAFQKREQIMRKGITDALGMLMAIPDDTGKIGEVGSHLADVLAKEASVVVPTGHGDGTWVNKGESLEKA